MELFGFTANVIGMLLNWHFTGKTYEVVFSFSVTDLKIMVICDVQVTSKLCRKQSINYSV